MQDVEGMIRTLNIALEMRIKERIMPEAIVLHCLIEYAAEVLNRYRIGTDKKTPRQRWNPSLRAEPVVAEFGECILSSYDRGQQSAQHGCEVGIWHMARV